MKKQFLHILIAFFIPLSITPILGQTKDNNSPILIKEFFNYEPLEVVFEKFISKYGLKINYKKEEIKDINLTYAFSNTEPEQAIAICLRGTSLSFVSGEAGIFFIFDRKKKTPFVVVDLLVLNFQLQSPRIFMT